MVCNNLICKLLEWKAHSVVECAGSCSLDLAFHSSVCNSRLLQVLEGLTHNHNSVTGFGSYSGAFVPLGGLFRCGIGEQSGFSNGEIILVLWYLFGEISGHFESICNCSFVFIFRGGIGSGLRVGEIILVLLQVFSKMELVADLPFFSLFIGSRSRPIRLSKFSSPGVRRTMGSDGRDQCSVTGYAPEQSVPGGTIATLHNAVSICWTPRIPSWNGLGNVLIPSRA